MIRVGGGSPLIILNKSAEREQGPKVQLLNINAAKVRINYGTFLSYLVILS
jgi:hypothetical protein